MKVAVCQFEPRLGEAEENRKRMVELLASIDAELVVLPELAVSGYNFSSKQQLLSLAEEADGKTAETLTSLAKKTGARYVVGIPEASDGKLYNSAIMVGPQGLEGSYRKVHLFYKEKEFFRPGEAPFPLIDVDGVKIGLLICFDHMFPEAARTLALKGAQIICHPSNLVLPEYGQLTSRVRALENRVFWLLANRTGQEKGAAGELSYTGASQIVSCDGSLLAVAKGNEQGADEIIYADIDPRKAKDKAVTALNDLFGDRRPAFYSL